MQTMLIAKKIDYNGSELRSHFIFEEMGLAGNACVAFIGGCDVSLEHMVDLVDKKARCEIKSREMLHFIAENFDTNLEAMVLRQRLFVAIIKDVLNNPAIRRQGNDLYDGDAKINISIATASPVSCLMHIGVNIVSDGTPVKTKALEDYGIDPKIFAEEVLKRYRDECDGVDLARVKAKPVK